MMAVQPFFKVVALTFTFGTVCYMVENVWKPNELKLLPNSREAEVKREDVFPPREQRYLQRDGQLTSANASKLLQYYISKVVQKNFKIELKNIEAFTKEIVNTIFLNQTRLKRNVTEIVAENNGM